MREPAFWAVVVAAVAVIVNACVSVFLHFRRATFEESLAKRKFDFDVSLAERKVALDYISALHQRRQQIASEILTSFYEVKQMMPAIRSGASWQGEGASRPPLDDERPELKETRDAYYVTIARLDKNREAIARLLSKQYSAMALFGTDAGKPFEDFNSVIARITTSASMLIRTAGNERPPPSTVKWHADIWEGYGDAKDEVNIELGRITAAVEAMCKPSLSAKAPALSDVSNGALVSAA